MKKTLRMEETWGMEGSPRTEGMRRTEAMGRTKAAEGRRGGGRRGSKDMSDGERRATERKRLREKTVKSELKVRHADQPHARIRSRSRHVLRLQPALIKRVQKGFVRIYFLLRTSLFPTHDLFSLPLVSLLSSHLFSPTPVSLLPFVSLLSQPLHLFSLSLSHLCLHLPPPLTIACPVPPPNPHS